MAAVAAGVGERARFAGLGSHQQHAVRARADRALGADRSDIAGMAHTDPSGEDVALLPIEDLGIDVGLPRQHARSAERCQRRGQVRSRNRRTTIRFDHAIRLVAVLSRFSPIAEPSRAVAMSVTLACVNIACEMAGVIRR